MKFTLTVTTGGTVRDWGDLASVLRRVADEELEPGAGAEAEFTGPCSGTIYRAGAVIVKAGAAGAAIGQWALTETGERQPAGQWCFCGDVPEGQVPHDCSERARHGTCQYDGAHVHPDEPGASRG